MLIIIAVSVILLLPIIAYLLHPLSNQKSIIFLTTFLIFGLFIINFFSSNSIIGSWVHANQSESIYRSISQNEELNSSLINQYLNNTSSKDESFMRGIQVFYKALELQSFDSAESMLQTLNAQFISENFQVPIFNLLADLRDAKYPDLANSKLLISIESPSNCNLQSLQFFVSIPGGPDVNIAAREIISPVLDRSFILDKSHSLVRGFDITSAFLQQVMIKIEAQARCDNSAFQAFKSKDLKYSKGNQDELFFYANEWLKKEQ
ncbi:hypothetical protein OAN78_03190 [Gammaproteobacteria bacterium]|nr:hypothetical protein [Gammaproteobacteria bacterium]MDC0332647.1 hypothetical protein [Gammaproteobacteria bacterium]MDC0919678.1 hypothetical protein [Gammaproteobacteria bacterium]